MKKTHSSLEYAEIQGLKLFLHWLEYQEKNKEIENAILVVNQRLKMITD